MREVIRETCEFLGVNVAEAELIVSTLLQRPRFEVYLQDVLDDYQRKFLKLKLIQIKKGIPIEYITKRVQFLSYTLTIFPGVFIPRVETEYFVELIGDIINFKPKRVLEIGTGCGAISIALKDIFPEAEIFATDRSLLALQNALENIKRFNLHNRIHLVCANLFESINSHFDLIVANPPYIPTERINYLPKGVKEFEPRMALDGGLLGIQLIKRIIENSSQFLCAYDGIALEIDEDSVSYLAPYLKEQNLPFLFKKDLFDRYRYLFVGNFNEKG